LKIVKCEIDGLKFKLDKPGDVVTEYCAEIINNIQIAKESVILKADEACEHLQNQVRAYEKMVVGSLEEYQRLMASKEEFETEESLISESNPA
jgi:hypothetical protein